MQKGAQLLKRRSLDIQLVHLVGCLFLCPAIFVVTKKLLAELVSHVSSNSSHNPRVSCFLWYRIDAHPLVCDSADQGFGVWSEVVQDFVREKHLRAADGQTCSWHNLQCKVVHEKQLVVRKWKAAVHHTKVIDDQVNWVGCIPQLLCPAR